MTLKHNMLQLFPLMHLFHRNESGNVITILNAHQPTKVFVELSIAQHYE